MAPLNDDEKTGTTNWLRSHLAAIGSAAVISVYAIGYGRTSAAAARVAGEAPPRRRPVARVPIAPAEIAQQPTPRAPADTQLAPAVTASAAVTAVTAATAVTTPAAVAPHEAAKADSATTSAAAPVASGAAVTAPAPAPATPATATPPVPVDSAPAQAAPKPQTTDSSAHVAFKDGVYAGWGTSRHGDIEATVEIKNGHVVSAMITQCLTRYSCSWISALPPQVVERQSAEVDYVSGATESSNAFYGAVAQALGKAK